MKRRLSASIDEDLLAAAERAVAEGRAPSVSALVEEALAARIAHEDRRSAARELFDWVDEEWGPRTDADRRAADLEIDAKTVRVRPRAPSANASSERAA